jgi:hypothetical protein
MDRVCRVLYRHCWEYWLAVDYSARTLLGRIESGRIDQYGGSQVLQCAGHHGRWSPARTDERGILLDYAIRIHGTAHLSASPRSFCEEIERWVWLVSGSRSPMLLLL